jgi:hypothetical protein
VFGRPCAITDIKTELEMNMTIREFERRKTGGLLLAVAIVSIAISIYATRGLFFLHIWSPSTKLASTGLVVVLWAVVCATYFVPAISNRIAIGALITMISVPMYKLLLYLITTFFLDVPYLNLALAEAAVFVSVIVSAIVMLSNSLKSAVFYILAAMAVQLPLAIQYSIFLQHT